MKSRSQLLALAAAGLLGACASPDYNPLTAKGYCTGANACKGTSDCATATSACKGLNNCKGQGFLYLSKPDCAQAGGVFES
ncbi:MAG: hypothetical protein AAF434_19585 [Pseudomonadota bacterium]